MPAPRALPRPAPSRGACRRPPPAAAAAGSATGATCRSIFGGDGVPARRRRRRHLPTCARGRRSFDYARAGSRGSRSQLARRFSGFIDAGVGYRFNNYIRADVTGEYRTAAHYSAIESYNQGYYNVPADGSRGYDTYSGSIRSVVGLLNGYVDVGTWYGVTPFVGAGVGVANVAVRNVIDLSPYGGFGFAPDHSQTNFAFAFMAGLDFAVTPNLSLELGYRYLNLGNASSGHIACANEEPCPNEVQHYRLQSNDIRLGFRYSFADYAPPIRPVVARY